MQYRKNLYCQLQIKIQKDKKELKMFFIAGTWRYNDVVFAVETTT